MLRLLACLLLLPPLLSAQVRPATTDTTASDTTARADSLQTLETPRSATIEGPVRYKAEFIRFNVPEQTTEMRGKVRIEYQNITLTAGEVSIDWRQNRMIAMGVADSTDSLGNAVYRDLPVLVEKGDSPITGFRLDYDFRTKRGRVLEGRTEMDPGYYRGERIRKIGNETLLIRDGYFTTCDNEDHPHFYFRTNRMRVRVKKTAVAKPVYLYIADVPILAAPFAVFSLRKGRRSGIILPNYGENSYGGRFLEDFGYYWAPNDYMDLTLLASFYERTGLNYTGKLVYKKRYSLDGVVDGSYAPKDVTTGEKRERWQLRFRHNQTIGQTWSITGQGNFTSDKNYLSDYYTDYDQRTNQNLETNVSVRKKLPGSRSLTLNARRFENLQTERVDYTFPDLTYSQPALSLIPGGRGSDKSWYHNIKYSYSSSLRSQGSNNPSVNDSTGEITFRDERKSAWQHNIRPTWTGKMGYFTIQPSVSLSELWVPEYLEWRVDSTGTGVVADTVQDFRARHLATGMGVDLRTTVYGLWEVPFSPLRVIRHKMDPSIGVGYQPDYSDDRFGYYQTLTLADGSTVKRDRFSGNIFGGTPSPGEERNINLGLNNTFQGKWIQGEEEKKVDLFTLRFNTSYNAQRDSLKWSNVRTAFQAKPHQRLNVTVNANHSFYKLNEDRRRRDEYVWSEGFALPELLDWTLRANMGWSLKPKSGEEEIQENLDTLGLEPADQYGAFGLQRDRDFRVFDGVDIPWSLDFNLTYSYADNGSRITRRFDGRVDALVQLTKNWKVNWSTQLNIQEREIVSQRFSVRRDLHCWEMNFVWSPSPNFSYYRLEIRVKESMLRDLKLTKTAGGRPY